MEDALSHPLPEEALHQHLIVLGKTRVGKSSTLRTLVEPLLDEDRPVCIIDPKGDWWGLKSSADGKHPGYPVVIFGGEHADVPITPAAGAVVAEVVCSGNRSAIIDVRGWMPSELARFFIGFASTLFRLTREPRWLVIDEVHNFAPQAGGRFGDPETAKMLHWCNRLITEGGGLGLTIFSASQRPQKVHKDFVTSNETLIAMKVIHPLDRAATEDWMKGAPDKSAAKEVLDTLASLRKGEAWVWSPEIAFGPVRVQFPLFKTFDSFKPPVPGAKTKAQPKGWASIDLAEVKGRLASIEEEAKANDPAYLKRKIAELEKAVKGKAPDLADVETRLAAAAADGERRGFVQANRKIAPVFDKVREAIRNIRAEADRLLAALDLKAEEPETAKPMPAFDGSRFVSGTVMARPVMVRPARPSTKKDPLQRILDAFAWWRAMKVEPTPPQVAFIAGYSHKGGTWSTYLSRLRSRGDMESREFTLTEKGWADAHGPQVPPTGEQLRSVVLDHIDAPLSKIMNVLIEFYPDEMSQEDAAAAAGYSHAGGTWSTYLSRLRSLDLINRGRGLKAQDWLFP